MSKIRAERAWQCMIMALLFQKFLDLLVDLEKVLTGRQYKSLFGRSLMKVHILGGPGSGKSGLADVLGHLNQREL